MNRKGLFRVIISLIVLPFIYLEQKITMAIEQPVLPEVRTDMTVLKPGGAAPSIESVRVNPFLTFEEERDFFSPKEPSRVMLDYFNLSAIFCSQIKTENKAIINGRIYKTGDEIDAVNSKKIVEIQPKAVILRDTSGLEYLLMLYQGSEK
ncbi:MAG TPA: hypothetical protein DEQ77_00450 [Candidatus Omnitrophica bacterium]|nr:hypothetical protein [Candidatus Omnitrophota bacterium]